MQAENIESVLASALEMRQAVQLDPVLGKRGVGVPDADVLLEKLSLDLQMQIPGAGRPFDGPDVVLASQIYKDGGHSGLIGDLARALGEAGQSQGGRLRVVITNLHGHHPKSAGPAHLGRLGPAAEQLTVLQGGSQADKLMELLGLMRDWRPRRVFLFHHPDDPLPVVASGPGWCGQSVLIHHADATPSFGLHLPGTLLVDLNPTAAAFSRMAGYSPALLPLTTPDPGPLPPTFLARGKLVTATCARGHKVRSDGPITYAAAVGVMLAAIGGWHVHIGSLEQDLLEAIQQSMEDHGVATDRFLYLPLVPSLPRALHEHAVDVYVSSFPVDGARTNVEVAAAGITHLRFRAPGKSGPEGGFPLAGSLAWSDWDSLRGHLRMLENPLVLAENSRLIRETYETQHHPRVFARIMQDILAGGKGWEDPLADARDEKARRALAKPPPGE